jgi:acyl transferase domain-containing protein
VFAPILRPGRSEATTVATAIGALQVHGTQVDWRTGSAQHLPELPTYPFQTQRYWLPPAAFAARSGSPEGKFLATLDRPDSDELASALDLDDEQRIALDQVWPALVNWRAAHRAAEPAPAGPAAQADSAWLREMIAAPAAEQEELLVDLLRTHVAAVLGQASPERIEGEHSLLELGFSSFTALELSTRLKNEAGVHLPPIAIYDHPTPVALARYLRAELTT